MKWKTYFRNFLIESEFLKPKLTFSRYVWKCNRGWKMALIVLSKLLQRRSRTHLWFRQNPIQKWLWSEKTHLWIRYVRFYINIHIMSVFFSLTTLESRITVTQSRFALSQMAFFGIKNVLLPVMPDGYFRPKNRPLNSHSSCLEYQICSKK